ncbi:hypothetical protein BDR07DRAFT_1383014 [Suillus spraguei]|nr:hypothetical protein BDR07DRAFT_1383014 [Suillus spraguei]
MATRIPTSELQWLASKSKNKVTWARQKCYNYRQYGSGSGNFRTSGNADERENDPARSLAMVRLRVVKSKVMRYFERFSNGGSEVTTHQWILDRIGLDMRASARGSDVNETLVENGVLTHSCDLQARGMMRGTWSVRSMIGGELVVSWEGIIMNMSMSLFDLGSDLCPEAIALVEKFATIHAKVKVLTKCIPEDREDLAAEKKQWMNEWTFAMGVMAKCRLDGKTYSLALVLPLAENAVGLEASKVYDRWTKQVHAALLAAKIKREQEKLAAAADEKGKEKEVAVVDMPMKEVTGGDAEGTVMPLASTEGTSRPKLRPRIGRRPGNIVYSKPCERCARLKLLCSGERGYSCWPCCKLKTGCVQSRYFGKHKAKSAAKTLPTSGDSSSGKAGSEVTAGSLPEAAIELTEGEEMHMGEVAEDSDMEDEAEFQRQLDELCAVPDLFFLADAEMRKLDVQYMQMQDLMKEMAMSMKYLYGYLDHIKKARSD